MQITGKIIGGLLGYLLTHSLIGVAIGVWIGHSFDRGLSQNFDQFFTPHDPVKAQAIFFEASFAMMGHLAKADGVVTQGEIAAAEQVMRQLGVSGERRQQAIDAFNRGKSTDFDFNQCLQDLKQHCARSPSLVQMFLEIQIVAATADAHVSAPEMQILYRIGMAFGVSARHIETLVDMVIAQRSFRRDGTTGQYTTQQGPSLAQAYKVLGVANNASKQEVKRAYRKLMAQHHPDKLVSKGMPPEMVKVATEKSQEIQSAYEMIKKHQGF